MELKKKIIKIRRNSQRPRTGKRGDACVKKKGPPDKRGKLILFQQWPAEWQHLPLVAAVSVNSMPKYKKLRNGPIELRTKTLDLGKLPKVTNTLLKL